MAYTPCVSNVAKSIAIDCNEPIVGGYTGRAVLIPADKAEIELTNNIIESIGLATSASTIALDNVMPEAFTGSQTQSNADNGRVMYTKTLAFRIPKRGGANSVELVEPLVKYAHGFIAVLEKKDKGIGHYEVFGAQQALRVNADGVLRDEAANGGDVQITMSCTENAFEIEYQGDAFEALFTTDAFPA